MKNWTISKRITSGFGLLILIGAAVSGVAIVNLRTIKARTESITSDSLPGVILAGETVATARKSMAVVIEHILADDAAEKRRLEGLIQSYSETMRDLMAKYEKTITASEDRAQFEKLKAARDVFWAAREKAVLAPSRELKTKEAMAGYREQAQPAFEKYAEVLQQVRDWNKSAALTCGDQILGSVRAMQMEMVAGSIVSLLLGVGLATFIIRSTTRVLNNVTAQLDESTEQVGSAASQISGASQSLAAGASEQAASLEETSASLEEMASMCARNAENAQSAKSIASETRSAADVGASDMQAMSVAMADIQASGDNISKIIKTIDEIAFQTNILALNAAVEAARAGDAGMGFAVVADEVRSLAQRSAHAAKETAEKIEDSIAKSRHGVVLSEKVSSSLNQIVQKAGRVDELVASIAQASQEQAQGIGQVNQAMTQMDKVTQSNAASAEEAASASEELHALARSTQETVGSLKQLMGQDSTEKVHSPKRATAAFKAAPTVPTKKTVASSSFAEAMERGGSAAVSSTPARGASKSIGLNGSRSRPVVSESDFQNF